MRSFEYSVVPLADLVESPSRYLTANTKRKEIATSLTQGLNSKDSEGWELVTIYATVGTGFAVFKREKNENKNG